MRTSHFAALVASLVALPLAASAQEAPPSGTLTITIEGTLPGPSTAMPPVPSGYQVDPSVVLTPMAPTYPRQAESGALLAAPSRTEVAPTIWIDDELPRDRSRDRPRTRRRVGLMVGGALTTFSAWAGNIVGTIAAFSIPAWNSGRVHSFFASFVPVAGPLVQIGFRDGDWQIPFFITASALQLSGFIMTFVGTFSRTPIADEASVMVAPYASADSAGLNVLGSF